MIDYTGHPLVDVGLATIAANVKKSDVRTITVEDMDIMVDYISKHYFDDPVQSFIWSMFPNSAYTQPSIRKSKQKRERYIETLKASYRPNATALSETCVYCGAPANFRAFREHIPLVGSIHANNFYPDGKTGLPICGLHLLSL